MSEVEPEAPAEPDTPDTTDPGTPDEPAEPSLPEQPDGAPEPGAAPQEPEQPAESPEVAPPVESGLSQEQANKISKDAATDWSRFRQRTVERWETEGEHLRDCPLCFDNHKGLVDLRDAGQYPRELVNGVMAFLGLAREIDYKQSGKHNPCTFCDANGKVATGSQVPEHSTVTCPECKGYGYTPPPSNVTNLSLATGGEGSYAAAPVDDIQQAEIDNWGEPKTLPDGRINPNYGKMPSFKILVPPYGITANIAAVDAADA